MSFSWLGFTGCSISWGCMINFNLLHFSWNFWTTPLQSLKLTNSSKLCENQFHLAVVLQASPQSPSWLELIATQSDNQLAGGARSILILCSSVGTLDYTQSEWLSLNLETSEKASLFGCSFTCSSLCRETLSFQRALVVFLTAFVTSQSD